MKLKRIRSKDACEIDYNDVWRSMELALEDLGEKIGDQKLVTVYKIFSTNSEVFSGWEAIVIDEG